MFSHQLNDWFGGSFESNIQCKVLQLDCNHEVFFLMVQLFNTVRRMISEKACCDFCFVHSLPLMQLVAKTCFFYRVDVHRKDNVGSLEKAITIYGNPDNCTNACRRILEVMQQEANNTNKGYLSYKSMVYLVFCIPITYENVYVDAQSPPG